MWVDLLDAGDAGSRMACEHGGILCIGPAHLVLEQPEQRVRFPRCAERGETLHHIGRGERSADTTHEAGIIMEKNVGTKLEGVDRPGIIDGP